MLNFLGVHNQSINAFDIFKKEITKNGLFLSSVRTCNIVLSSSGKQNSTAVIKSLTELLLKQAKW